MKSHGQWIGVSGIIPRNTPPVFPASNMVPRRNQSLEDVVSDLRLSQQRGDGGFHGLVEWDAFSDKFLDPTGFPEVSDISRLLTWAQRCIATPHLQWCSQDRIAGLCRMQRVLVVRPATMTWYHGPRSQSRVSNNLSYCEILVLPTFAFQIQVFHGFSVSPPIGPGFATQWPAEEFHGFSWDFPKIFRPSQAVTSN